MAALNLTANGTEQERILAYLQENASDVLTEKINNGTPIEKDGKTLINKKTFDGFMNFACDEARKQAEKGARAACIDDATVFGWAIHYFEEDTIEGKLYNQDGTEYTPPKPVVKPKPAPKPIEPPKPKQQQATLWDMLETANNGVTPQTDDNEVIDHAEETDDEDDEQPTPEEIQEILAEVAEQEKHEKAVPLFFTEYMDLKASHKNEIVLKRLGDFYEAFDNDATILANELDLTLTGRNVGLESRVPMVGFPYHAADVYIEKIRINHGVVIIESNGEIVTLGRIVKTDGKAVDADTGEVINTTPTPSESDDDIIAREREIAKAFDKDALIKLSDLLGNIFTLG